MIELRQVLINEKADLFSLHKRSLGSYIDRVFGWDEEQQVSLFDKEFREENCYWIVKDGERVGAIRYVENEQAIYITIIEIEPEFQSRGIGKKVIEDLYKKSKKDLELQVFKINSRAKSFYEKLGFIQYGETDCHFKMRMPHS
ncbi:GNAT family N-acetyltransferase [Lusitaniella coriacea]|uniref:GNAT family N-acetyltransferase n=1 Tax=Lusitaniella coriacea TaxID=1983105 RepID=UPI003CFB6B42